MRHYRGLSLIGLPAVFGLMTYLGCSAPDPGCVTDADCEDGQFCNGVEVCGEGGLCESGASPCAADQTCDESVDSCDDGTAALSITADTATSLALLGNALTLNVTVDGGTPPYAYTWRKLSGAPTRQSDMDSGALSITLVTEGVAVFSVTVTDANGRKASTTVSVTTTAGGDCSDVLCDDGIYCNGRETCVNGICRAGTPPCAEAWCDEDASRCHECDTDEDCVDDGTYCNGPEICVDGGCRSKGKPCPAGVACNEFERQCKDCESDEECSDGLFCTGVEVCVDGLCAFGPSPCEDLEDTVCNEVTQSCEPKQHGYCWTVGPNEVSNQGGVTVGQLFWTEPFAIKRAGTTGGHIDTVVTNGTHSNLGLSIGVGAPGKIGQTRRFRYLYWVSQAGTDLPGHIYRATLAGNHQELFLTPSIRAVPFDVAVWCASGDIWWTEQPLPLLDEKTKEPPLFTSREPRIAKTDYLGRHIETVVQPTGERPYAIDVWEDGEMVYWSEFKFCIKDICFAGSIKRAHVEATLAEHEVIISGLCHPHDIAIDPIEEKIYWSDSGMRRISRADLDGEHVEVLLEGIDQLPLGVALDLDARKMYWVERDVDLVPPFEDKIRRANLDGTGDEDVITDGLWQPYDLEFIPAHEYNFTIGR